MDGSQAKNLIEKYREGILSAQEKVLLESWYLDLAKTDRDPIEANRLEIHLDAVWESLPIHQPGEVLPVSKIRPLVLWLATAASVLVFCSLGIYFINDKKEIAGHEKVIYGGDAIPGDNRAILTLADGAKIALDKMQNGELAREGNTSIIKTNSGEVVYRSDDTKPIDGGAITFNTILTPKAGQYQIKLPDGTKVWLNAASSIRFPTTFPKHERIVEIMGEVYFEVAKVTAGNKRVPFKVKAGTQVVEVLGTRFNINSYKDEGLIKTTLLEGSIKVHAEGNKKKEILLKPGQQSQFITNREKSASEWSALDVREVNALSVIAWKDGYFRFDNVGLPELMRQLSRWYDVQVIYDVPIKEYEFVGHIERNSRLSKVLKILEMGDVHFKIEGRKIIVTE